MLLWIVYAHRIPAFARVSVAAAALFRASGLLNAQPHAQESPSSIQQAVEGLFKALQNDQSLDPHLWPDPSNPTENPGLHCAEILAATPVLEHFN